VSSPFYRQAIGVEKIYQFLESNPEYMKQVSSQRLAGFSLQKILKLELDQLFMTAVEAPGAKINEGSRKTGQTPAHMAAKLGNIANMQKLLEKGASLATVNFKDRTPLIQSLMSDQTEMSLFILQQPQDLNLNQIDVEGHTALYYAITHGQTAAIEPLFRKGADFQFHDMYGIIQNNALHEAVNSENPEILKAVLATQVLAIDEADVKGLTPLMKAAMNNQEELVRILLAAGASKTLASPNGKTATDFARKRGYQSIVDLLQ
jgi:ankyrin repeat protein